MGVVIKNLDLDDSWKTLTDLGVKNQSSISCFFVLLVLIVLFCCELVEGWVLWIRS